MRVLKTDYIGKKRRKDLAELIAGANAADGTRYSTIDDADVYGLIYDEENRLLGAAAVFYMGDTRNGLPIAELAAFTRPDCRRQGYFRRLLEKLGPELEGYALRFAVYKNEAALQTLSALSAVPGHEELMLSISTDKFSGEDAQPAWLTIDAGEGRAFSEQSECWFRSFGDSVYLFGVQTYANYQRKGYAEALLKAVLAYFYASGTGTAILQVSSENLPALRLYERLGMEETERLSYYYLEPFDLQRKI